MFYILIILGVSLISLGLFNNKDKRFNLEEELLKPIDNQELNDLEYRIENIENMLFYLDEKKVKKPAKNLKTFDMLRHYEEKGYSMDDICTLLEMNKGEVLLLKNLYKDY